MKIRLRHVKEGGKPCTAKENIAALAENHNSWMTGWHIALCKSFSGTESEASNLLDEIEHDCTLRHAEWEQSQ